MDKQVIYFYYGVDSKAGIKRKYLYCFFHAVRKCMKGLQIETEIEEGHNFKWCDVCSGNVKDE